MQLSKFTIRFAILTLAGNLSAFGVTPRHIAAPVVVPGEANLLQTAKDDNREAVRRLIAHHVDVNAAQGDGFTALHWAAYNDDIELTRLLLKAGAAPEPRTRLEGVTPLILAARNGDAALIGILLAGGAKPDTADDNGTTPLMQAAAAGVPSALKELLDHGANVNAREKTYGQSALFFAADRNRYNAILYLTEHGADTTFKTSVQKLQRISVGVDGEELTPLKKGPKAAGSAYDETDASGEPARHAHKRRGLNAIEPVSASASESTKNSKTNQTSHSKSGAETKKNDADAYGFTAEDRKNRVYGSLTIGGLTALHVAARDGDIDAAKALVLAHADINARTGTDKSTPLLLALINGHYDLAKYLIEQNADVTLTSTDGLGPMYAVIDVRWAPHTWYAQPVIAQEKTSYLELLTDLLQRGADPNARLTRKLWFRVFANDETWVDVTGSTPFWRAALAGDLKAMQLLAEHGANTNLASKSGDTPLMVAAGLGWAAYWTSNAPSSRLDAVKFCLEHGSDVNTRDVKGYSAIHGAAFRGDDRMIEYLLARGANPHIISKAGDTVADSANGLFEHAVPHPETVTLLERLGVKSSDNCRSNECVVPPKKDKPLSVASNLSPASHLGNTSGEKK